MKNGYWGKILYVDLTTRSYETVELDEKVYREYLGGGTGIGVHFLYNNMPANADPLGKDNILGFLPGLFNSTGIPFSSRFEVVAKSPMTGTWGDANCGGNFGPRMKRSGWDGVFVRGISDKPVYLWIKDDEVEIRDAFHLWGKSAKETEQILWQETGKKTGVASIGVPGEKLAYISCIMNDHGRAAARSGLGAVMGSKRLKAVAVQGNKTLPVTDSAKLKEIKSDFIKKFQDVKPKKSLKFFLKLFKPLMPGILRKRGAGGSLYIGNMLEMFKDMGTSMSPAAQSQGGDSPVKNWKGVGYRDFPMQTHANKIAAINYHPFRKKKYACNNCPIGCGAELEVPDINGKMTTMHRPEYETIAAFGCNILNDDILTVLRANEICNAQGMDTISAGSVVAFAMECFEKGLITLEDTEGLDLTWGKSDEVIRLLEKIVNRDGIGDVLADGSKFAAERIGGSSEDFAMHVGGQDLAMHDPRLISGWGATYVTDPTPGRHTAGTTGIAETGTNLVLVEGEDIPIMGRQVYTGKGKYQKIMAAQMQVMNSTGICAFEGWTGMPFPFAGFMKALTGWDIDPEEVQKSGQRVQIMRHIFNVREGIRPSDFKMPARAQGTPPLQDGPNAGVTPDIETMANDYYRNMGLSTESGAPSEAILEDLGLEYVKKDLQELTH